MCTLHHVRYMNDSCIIEAGTHDQLAQLQVIMREYIMLISLLKMMTGHSEAKFELVRVSDLVSVSHSNIWLAAPRRTQAWTP